MIGQSVRKALYTTFRSRASSSRASWRRIFWRTYGGLRRFSDGSTPFSRCLGAWRRTRPPTCPYRSAIGVASECRATRFCSRLLAVFVYVPTHRIVTSPCVCEPPSLQTRVKHGTFRKCPPLQGRYLVHLRRSTWSLVAAIPACPGKRIMLNLYCVFNNSRVGGAHT